MKAKILGSALQSIFIVMLGIICMYWSFACIFCLLVPDCSLPCIAHQVHERISLALQLFSLSIFCAGYFSWNNNTVATAKFVRIVLPIIMFIQVIEGSIDIFRDLLTSIRVYEPSIDHFAVLVELIYLTGIIYTKCSSDKSNARRA